MNDPYLLLDIEETATDTQVREAYHRQLKLHPPEQSPERFASISEAYETIRTLRDRIYHRLFGPYPDAKRLDDLVRDVDRRLPCLPQEAWIKAGQRLWLAERINAEKTKENES